jgi:TP901 family phage tail tape measure protein
MNIAIILTAIDRMSSVVNNATNSATRGLQNFSDKANNLSKSAFSTGRDFAGMAVVAGAALSAPIKAFADLEDSSASLSATMMEDGGKISAAFKPVSELAIQLGNKLPGTTADFNNMFDTLLRGGVSSESILNGVGKAAAYLAVGIKIPYEDAAKMTAKLKEATGIADSEMLQFMDTIARVNTVGVEAGEMQMSFARSAGTLKTLGLQGLDATKSVSAVYAMLIKAGASGEQVGTGMSAIFSAFYDKTKMNALNQQTQALGINMDFVDQKTGKFKGIENMVAQFDKLKGLNTQQKTDIVTSLLGTGADAKFALTLIDGGINSFNDMQNRLAKQGTLDKKVESQLKTLKNQWDAATGTFQNTMAQFGQLLLPILIKLIDKFNALSARISAFISKHPGMAKLIGMAVIGFTTLAAGGAILAFSIGGVSKAAGLMSSGLKIGIQFLRGTWAVMRSVAVGGARFLAFAYNFATSSVTRLRVAVMLKNTYLKIATALSRGYAFVLRMVGISSGTSAAAQGGLATGLGVETAAATGAASATWAFNSALLANPIVWIIGLIILLCAAVYLIIKNWDKVKAFFVNMWKNIKKVFSDAWEWIKASIYKYSGMKFIVENWGKIKAWFSNMWQSIKDVFSNFWEWLKEAMYKYSGIKFIVEGWGKVKHFFSDMWDKVKGTFTSFFNWITGIPGRLFQAGKNMVNSLWKGIKDMAMKPVNAIKDIVKKIRSYLPFSPAKEGPLMDIHRIRLVETIAEGIKPNAIVEKMKHVATMAIQPLQQSGLTGSGSVVPGGSSGPSINNSSNNQQGGNTLHYAPVITFAGGADEKGKEAFADMLKKHKAEVEGIFKNLMAKQERTKIA